MKQEKQVKGLYKRNLLDFKSDFVNFKLQYMMEDLFYNYRALASEKFLECFLVMPESLKRSYKADPIKIEYILSSLLAYCVESSQKGRIDLMVNQKKQYGNIAELCFVVQNTGTGTRLEDSKVKSHYESLLSLESLNSESLNKVFTMAKYIGGEIDLKPSGYYKGVQFKFVIPMEIIP